MSEYKTVRGKMVTLSGISLAVDDDGTLHIMLSSGTPGVQGRQLTASGDEASRLYSLLGDVLEWESNRGMTEARFEKVADADDRDHESGKMDYDFQHGPGGSL